MERRLTPQPPQGQEGAQRTEVVEQEVDLAREEEDEGALEEEEKRRDRERQEEDSGAGEAGETHRAGRAVS